jgi:hypothetical protein
MFDKADERACRGGWNPTQSDSSDSFAVDLRSNRYEGLVFRLSGAYFNLDTIHICFVDFNSTFQLILARWHHHTL